MFQEDEKKHLARELHDGINQLLVSSRCHLELLGNKLQNEDLKAHLNKSLISVRCERIEEVSNISHQSRLVHVDDIGLEGIVRCCWFSKYTSIEVETLFSTQPGKLKSEAATTL